MNFRKTENQYHSCSREAERIVKLAVRYGAYCDEPSGNSSKYFTIDFEQADEQKYCSATCRVSRHEPNYSMRSDDDIMVYVGGFFGDWFDSAESFCVQFEKHFECDRPAKVIAYLNMLKTKRETKIAKKQVMEKKYKQLSKIRLKEAGEKRREVLKQRCHQHGITKNKINSAFSGEGSDDPCCIFSQLRKWFEGMDLEQALKFAI